MALIKCPECGREISDKAKACPGCGCPVEKEVVYEQNNSAAESGTMIQNGKPVQHETQENPKMIACHRCGNMIPAGMKRCEYCGYIHSFEDLCGRGKYSSHSQNPKPSRNNPNQVDNSVMKWLGGAAIALLALGAVSTHGYHGVIPAFMYLLCGYFISPLPENVGIRLPKWAKIAIPVCIFVLAVVFTPSSNEDSQTVVTEEAGTETQEQVETVSAEHPRESKITYKDIFVRDLDDNWSSYIGRHIRTSFEISRSYDEYIESKYDDGNIRVYLDNTEDYQIGDYVIVTGKAVDGNSSTHELEDAYIEQSGEAAESYYKEGLAEYNAKQAEKIISDRERFIENVESVTYDDLRRYPDTYKGKEIKLKIKIKEAKPDGLIFQGDIFATIPGTSNEIAVYDKRTVREPRFMDGDTVTVYAVADGLATIKVTQGSGLFKKTVDKYEVPSIKVMYTDKDDIEAIKKAAGVGDIDTDDAYESGKAGGEALKEILDDSGN